MVVVPEALRVCQGKLQALTGAGVKGRVCCKWQSHRGKDDQALKNPDGANGAI